MKTLFALFLPFFLYAQTPYPDTLYMKDSKIYPCLITAINNTNFSVVYANNANTTAALEAVESVSVDKYGAVYKSGSGYLFNEDDIKEFVDTRYEAYAEQQQLKAQEELAAKQTEASLQAASETAMLVTLPPFPGVQQQYLNNRWSFGVLYVPYFSGKVYRRLWVGDNGQSVIGSISSNETNLEAQAAYAVTERFRLTFDVGYTVSSQEEDYESHTRYNNNPSSDNNFGYIDNESIKLLLLNLGVKYYFKSFADNKVNIFVLGGLGKQFAFVSKDYTNKYPSSNPDNITEQNNEEDYLADLNSPWHFTLGFGAEYMFNESLSLYSSIRVYYTSASGKREYRLMSNSGTSSSTFETSISDLVTRVGLGINFYF